MTGSILRRNLKIRAKHKFCCVQRDYRDWRPWGDSYSFQTPEEEFRRFRQYEKIVCVSEAARKGIIETMGDPGNLCVKYNPINANQIRMLSKENCKLKKPSGKFLIVSVGRLYQEKQYMLLLQLAKALSANHNLEVWIIGEGEERGQLEEFISQNQLSFVKLLGFQANPYSYLGQADLFVSCSSSESYGLAIQEALILSIPTVAIRCSGIEESFDARFGIMVENDYGKMEAVLKELLDDPAQLKKYKILFDRRFIRETPGEHLLSVGITDSGKEYEGDGMEECNLQ